MTAHPLLPVSYAQLRRSAQIGLSRLASSLPEAEREEIVQDAVLSAHCATSTYPGVNQGAWARVTAYRAGLQRLRRRKMAGRVDPDWEAARGQGAWGSPHAMERLAQASRMLDELGQAPDHYQSAVLSLLTDEHEPNDHNRARGLAWLRGLLGLQAPRSAPDPSVPMGEQRRELMLAEIATGDPWCPAAQVRAVGEQWAKPYLVTKDLRRLESEGRIQRRQDPELGLLYALSGRSP
jgi:hypothetical protein